VTSCRSAVPAERLTWPNARVHRREKVLARLAGSSGGRKRVPSRRAIQGLSSRRGLQDCDPSRIVVTRRELLSARRGTAGAPSSSASLADRVGMEEHPRFRRWSTSSTVRPHHQLSSRGGLQADEGIRLPRTRSRSPRCARDDKPLKPTGSCWAQSHTPAYSFMFRRRKALLMTDTELKLMAAAASTGLNRMPNFGYSTPAAIGTPTQL
jgi:hypothetical protein